jgi:hypothetical protein
MNETNFSIKFQKLFISANNIFSAEFEPAYLFIMSIVAAYLMIAFGAHIICPGRTERSVYGL